MEKRDVLIRVWRKTVEEFEAAVMRVTPSIPEAKYNNETVESYVKRTQEYQNELLRQLSIAREELQRALHVDSESIFLD